MPILAIYRALRTIALDEFADVVVSAQVLSLPTGDPLKLRLDVADGSLLDVFISVSGRYSYHWERRLTLAGDLYRHDNAPHDKWRHVVTFPKHFHDGSASNVVESHISDDPEEVMREFLTFVRRKLLSMP
ncbi:MAG: DUF6516 family protein [Chloroflexota bacterium]|nr:DUF6516 family protein [Chloroflexota bacterium]